MFDYGRYDEDTAFTNYSSSDPAQTYYVKAGIRQRWNPLGHTVAYGEYLRGNDGGAVIAAGWDSSSTTSHLDVWGLGVVQEIDAAAMSIWLKYRHLSFDDNSGLNYEDFQYVGHGRSDQLLI